MGKTIKMLNALQISWLDIMHDLLHTYVQNNPVNLIDPLGLASTSGLPDLGAQPYLQNTNYIHWGPYDKTYYDAVNAAKTFINAFSNTLDGALGFIKGAPSVINPQKIWEQVKPGVKPADACPNK